MNEFSDSTHLFYKKDDVAKYTHQAIVNLSSPIAWINTIHSSTAAALAKGDDAGGLEPIVFVAKGAKILMLTSNLLQQVRLFNGAMSIIDRLLYAEQH